MTETWRPLGYNIRPKRLQAIAREAVATYGGQLPSDEATLLSFKGIGAYTAGAIRSFAFRERAAILDTNVARVLFRVFIGKGVPKAHATKKDLWSISAALVPRSRAFDFNQALMDFGATLCTARKPKCLICPDGAALLGVSAQSREREACLSASSSSRPSSSENGRFLVARRLAGTHLAGYWEFPRRQGARRERTMATRCGGKSWKS